jgi:hypothetical protein
MSITIMLAPLFVQVALTFALLIWLGLMRVPAVRRGEVKLRDIALDKDNWPPQAIQAANAFSNQFELPVLFYLVVVLAVFSAESSVTLAVLAWIFVASRLLHALIHVTTNNVPRRAMLYAIGAGALGLMWVVYIVGLVLAR